MCRTQIALLLLLSAQFHGVETAKETSVPGKTDNNQLKDEESAPMPGFLHFFAFYVVVPLVMAELARYRGPPSNTYLKEAGCSPRFNDISHDLMKMFEIRSRACMSKEKIRPRVVRFTAMNSLPQEDISLSMMAYQLQ
ncbi:hypothetical protein Y032_0008g170 [Ancylostoma ceylanicum]|uniref:Uncharacterized protein n=1 Tax=Ancylostoma ceylanicum TaxID=53326 RepID=A0A016VJG9_9BILA|nr:hypothetical protein Y032_0008g170 [Ancylostoma ceylanicum]